MDYSSENASPHDSHHDEKKRIIADYNASIAWNFSDVLIVSASLLTVQFVVLWPLIALLCSVYGWTGNTFDQVVGVWIYLVYANILATPLAVYYCIRHSWGVNTLVYKLIVIVWILTLIAVPLWLMLVAPRRFYGPESLTVIQVCGGWNSTSAR